MDTPELHRRCCDAFGAYVDAIGDAQWGLATPCEDWDVRALVHHLVYEDVWTGPLFEGQTIEQVGDRFEGDILGDDPKAAYMRAAREATDAVGADGAMQRTVHLSFGDYTGDEYAMQLTADHLIHAWDLARAIGADERLDPELVSAVRAWFEGVESLYRDAGVIGARVAVADGADEQTALLGMFGRSSALS